MALTAKRQRFVDEYCIDFNASQAVVRAGYKTKSPNEYGAFLLAIPSISAAIEVKKREIREKNRVDSVRILEEYTAIGLSDLGDILDFSGPVARLRPANEIPSHARRAISSMKVKRYFEGNGEDAQEVEVVEFRLWPKLDALKEIAVRVEPQKPIAIDLTSGGKPLESADTRRTELAALVATLRQRAGIDTLESSAFNGSLNGHAANPLGGDAPAPPPGDV